MIFRSSNIKMSTVNLAILVNILSEITNIVYVNAETLPSVSVAATFDVCDDMGDVADYVCEDLQFESEDTEFNVTACQENFLSSEADLLLSPPAIQVCRLEDSVVFDLALTDASWRLVLLVPDDDSVTDLINFNLVESDKSYDKISAFPEGSYTIWTASLDGQGRHSAWLRGPLVEPWKGTDQQYDIETELEYGDDKNTTVNAVFHWDNDDAKTACSRATFTCNGRIVAEDILWQNKQVDMTSWEVKNLPMDEKCELRVSGVRGTTIKNYRIKYDKMAAYTDYTAQNKVPNENSTTIPSKVDQELDESSNTTETSTKTPGQTKSDLQQSMPRNLTILAAESEGGWDVTVAWVPPIRTPTSYNVTLVAKHVQRTEIIPGDKTEVVIRNVQDEGYYYVIFETIIGKNITRTSRNAVFPEKSHLTSLIIAVGVLSAMILLVAAFMCLRKRRADKLKRSYFLDLDVKPSKDAMETFNVESSKAEENWEVGSRRLLLHEVVGEGAFGVVRRGTLGGEEVAVKMLKDFPTLDEIRSFHAEIELMKLMKTVGRHAHVLNLVECCPGRRPLILTEYCSGGDLLSYLRCIWDVMVSKRKAKYYNNNIIDASEYRNDLFKCKFERQSKLVVNKLYDLQGICDTELTSRDLLSFCRQIAMGMDFLASNKVVHRDLAARNILVAKDRTLKIADFGLSRDVYEENQYKQKGNGKMPVKWMALESLERKIYTTKSDIWSFGVVVWEIVTVGGSPYPDVPPARLLRFLREGYRMQKPNNCSMELYDLMLSCWHAQPSARPSFSELHRRLDELLNSVCAHDYLSLEMNEDARPALTKNRYVRMIKEKLGWSRSESYSYPCRAAHNHYSSPPALPAVLPA